MRIFCFGDSNTYGYDARSLWGERLPADQRWPELLAGLSGWEVVNEGMNGREIPHEDWAFASFKRRLNECEPVDLIVIMLGSNDLLNSREPEIEAVGARMERFLAHVPGRPVLLLAPPAMDVGRFLAVDGCYDEESRKFGDCYEKIASRKGFRFADTGAWDLPLAHDGVHLTPEGHRIMAGKLWELLRAEKG